MLVAKEELAIEVAQIDSVQVDDMYLTETCEDEVLEELATDASRSNHEHARLSHRQHVVWTLFAPGPYIFNGLVESAAEALPSKLVACHCDSGGCKEAKRRWVRRAILRHAGGSKFGARRSWVRGEGEAAVVRETSVLLE